MIAAVYARKSTEQNGVADEARSVTRQVARAREFAAPHGWIVPDALVFTDDGISGAEFEHRPGLQALLRTLAPKPPFTHLIVMDSSRIGREAWEANYVLKRLLQGGIHIWTYLDGREITVQDKLRHTVTGLVDDEERDRGRRRTRDAMLAKAKAGHVTGGVTFGYVNVEVRDAAGKRSHVVRAVEPAEAAVVRSIFRLYGEGYGYKAITDRLNAERAPAPKPRRPPNDARPVGWSPSTVRDVLLRPDYMGELRWGRVRKRDAWGTRHPQRQPQDDWLRLPAPHLAIVSRDVWEAAQARMQVQRAIYLRDTGGRLQSKPANGIATQQSGDDGTMRYDQTERGIFYVQSAEGRRRHRQTRRVRCPEKKYSCRIHRRTNLALTS